DLPALLAEGRELLPSDPTQAAERARHALAFAPHSPDAYRLLGAALRRLGQDAAANDAEMAAILESGNDPELAAAGEAMLREDYAVAEQMLRSVLQRRPEDVAAIRMLGEIAANFGALRDAERLLRKALDLAPGFEYARLHLALTLNQQNRSGEALAEVEKIAGELRDLDETRNLRASLSGRVGDYEDSATLYRQSVAEVRDQPARLTALVQEAERVFSRDLLTSRAGAGYEASDPIFIIGMPRAGSTLIEQILASHPQVEGTAELPDIINLARTLEPDERDFAQGVWKRYPAIVAEFPDSRLKELGELYVERTRAYRKTDQPHFTDKMPN